MELKDTALVCNGRHEHASWLVTCDAGGVWNFPTAEEAEYPDLLCDRMAAKVCAALRRTGRWGVRSETRLADQGWVVGGIPVQGRITKQREEGDAAETEPYTDDDERASGI